MILSPIFAAFISLLKYMACIFYKVPYVFFYVRNPFKKHLTLPVFSLKKIIIFLMFFATSALDFPEERTGE